MGANTQQQVDALLADLAATVDPEQPTGDADPSDPEEIGGIADRADELLSSTALSAVAAATGLGDGTDPSSSVPKAIATGDPKDVAALRALLTLAKLSTADDDRADELVSELASLVETAQLSPAEERTNDAAATVDAETIDAAETADGTAADEESSLRERLQSQLDETQALFDGLPADGLTEGSDGADSGTEPGGDDAEPGTETEDQAVDQSTRSRDGTRWRPGGGQRSIHSTVPGAGRRDIGRRPGRLSTMRGSTVSNR
ncbi:hypothetical protein [Halohasta salina]|uniref:hypothetical protein n=1 Tax=Halohasta salina TaxID=2961621 RepID=UPI0020A2D1F8|nr:hypothetical protein [Halohasta salina]